jgi:hypothetical protein
LFAVIAALVLVVRWDVINALSGDIPHPALRDVGIGGRVLIMLGVLPDLARLLVWPARLYADYSPDHIRVFDAPSLTQLNGVVVVVGALAIFAIAWRRSAVAAFGLLVAAAAWLPTANILFPSGILLSERTLYLPTAGVLLAVGTAVAWFDRKYAGQREIRGFVGCVLAVTLVLGISRSVHRSRAWRSSNDIFWTMRRDEPSSFRARYAWGAVLFDRKDLRGGEVEWRSAIRIFPNYPFVYEDLAHRYREYHLCHAAIPLYERALALDDEMSSSRQGLVACQLGLAQFRAARRTARLGVVKGHYSDWFRARLFSAESALVATDTTGR